MDSDAPTPAHAPEPEGERPADTPGTPGLLERLPGYTAPALLAGIPLLMWIGTLIAPRQIYDNFVWKYYWGPIKADGLGVRSLVHNGVEAFPGYNMVNTLSWVVLMAICILGLYQLLRHFQVGMGARAVYGATAWVVAGAIAHVLQDTDLILAPLEYIFITPPIYLLYAAGGVVAMLMGVYLNRVTAAAGLEVAFQKLWLILAGGVLVWLLLWLNQWGGVRLLINPIIVAVVAAAVFFTIRYLAEKKGNIEDTDLLLPLAVSFIVLDLVYVGMYIQNPWPGRIPGDGLPSSVITAPLLALVATGIAYLAPKRGLGVAVSLAVAVFATVFGAKFLETIVNRLSGITGFEFTLDLHDGMTAGILVILGLILGGIGSFRWARTYEQEAGEIATAFRNPINLLLIFSQTLDGFATSLGLDLAGYQEKHVLSAYVIDTFKALSESIGWGFGAAYPTFLAFAPLKFAISVLVVYVIDIYSKEEVEQYPNLIGIVKFAIIMVGIGPGVRDFVRLGLGV